MSWRIDCSRKRFRAGEIASTELDIVPPSGEILLASCTFNGYYLTRSTSVLFLESVPVPLAVNAASVRGLGYSVLLPEEIPPSYNGVNIAVAYTINVTVQMRDQTVSKSISVLYTSKDRATSIPTKGKLRVGDECIEVVPLPNDPENSATVNTLSDSLTDAPGIDGCGAAPHHALIVEVLRGSEETSAAWMPQIGQKDQESFRARITEKTQEILKKEIREKSKQILQREKELHSPPLRVLQALRAHREAASTERRSYSIKKGGCEAVSVFLTIRHEADTHWLLSLSIQLVEQLEKVKISLYHTESVLNLKKRELLHEEERSTSGCLFFTAEVPIDVAETPTITTQYFSTYLEMFIGLDTSSAWFDIK